VHDYLDLINRPMSLAIFVSTVVDDLALVYSTMCIAYRIK